MNHQLHHIFGSTITNQHPLSLLLVSKPRVIAGWGVGVGVGGRFLYAAKRPFIPPSLVVCLGTSVRLHILTCLSKPNFLRETAAQPGREFLLWAGYRPDFGSDARVARLLWNLASHEALGDWRQISW